MKFGLSLVFLFSLFPFIAGAQQDGNAGAGPPDTAPIPDAPRVLELKTQLKTSLKGALLSRAGCDEDGNIYLRPYISQRVSGLPGSTSPVQRMKPDGTMAEVFQNTDADGTKLPVTGVSVSADGKVYEAAWTPSDVYVISFAKDGSVQSRTRIQTAYFQPYQLAVFKSGEFLLSGTKGKDGHAPFTAVFSSDGKLLKELTEPEDEDMAKKAQAGQRGFVSENTPNFGNSTIEFGDAVSGSDGNVYLMRATAPAQIYAISSHGEVVRKLKIDAGNSGFVAHTIRAAKDGLAITFGVPFEKTETIIKVVTYSGDPIATYRSADQNLNPQMFACYSQGSFTFLGTSSDNSVFLKISEAR
jgi:hypothetical protein